MADDATSGPTDRLHEARRMMRSLPRLVGAERTRVEALLFGPYWPEYQRLLERGEVQQNAPAYQHVLNRRPRP